MSINDACSLVEWVHEWIPHCKNALNRWISPLALIFYHMNYDTHQFVVRGPEICFLALMWIPYLLADLKDVLKLSVRLSLSFINLQSTEHTKGYNFNVLLSYSACEISRGSLAQGQSQPYQKPRLSHLSIRREPDEALQRLGQRLLQERVPLGMFGQLDQKREFVSDLQKKHKSRSGHFVRIRSP